MKKKKSRKPIIKNKERKPVVNNYFQLDKIETVYKFEMSSQGNSGILGALGHY